MQPVLTTPSVTLAQTIAPQKASYRIDAIDLLRGLVMVIMALDHTRDFFHPTAWTDDPLNLNTTTPALFLTRWITHFCAPVFVFLAGTSGWFQSLRKSKKELSLFLIKRGLWLVLVEVTVVTFGIMFDVSFSLIVLQVIWAIGISMILLGLAIWLPFAAILSLGLLLVLGHNALDVYERSHQGNYSFWYLLLHRQGVYPLGGGHTLLMLYPFLPWTGLMLLGYCFGRLFTQYEGVQRRNILTALGAGILTLFVVLRALNVYGNPVPWSVQNNALYTFFSFINTHKYPPSLLYLCMTIGPAVLFLAWMGPIKNRFTEMVTVYGRVPFFYYVLHFYLIHLLSTFFYLGRGHTFAEGLGGVAKGVPNFVAPGEGYSLWVVYLVWLLVVAALYPLCKWFSEYKKTHRQWWLSYL